MSFRLFIVVFHLSNILTNDFQCFQRDFCSNSSLNNLSPSIFNDEIVLRYRNCFCDDRCVDFDDCCDRKRRRQTKTSLQCFDYLSPLFERKIRSFSPLPVRMRTKCLKFYRNSFVDQRCRNIRRENFTENPFLFVPVTSRTTNVTYRNYFCAFCNDDTNDETIFWSLKSFCSKNNLCVKTLIYPHEIDSFKPSIYLRPCKNIESSRCPTTTPIDLAEKCSKAPLTYRYNIRTFRVFDNEFCAQCHGENLTELSCVDPLLRSAIPVVSHLRVQPLEILFNPKIFRNFSCQNSNRFDETEIHLCHDRMMKFPVEFPFYRRLLSLIFSSISLICLLIFFINFLTNSSLQNFAGRSIFCLSLSIFVGQTIFLISSNFSPRSFICCLSAFLLHYFYLSSFLWLLVISRRISLTFQRQTIEENRTRNDENRRFFRQIFFVNFSSCMIVFVSFMFQWFFPRSNFSPHYAIVFCSISNPLALIIFFLFPIGSIFLVVFILFSRTILFIHRSRNFSRFATSNSTFHRNFLVIYIRLAFLMGFQWIFLLIALIFQRNSFWFVFDLINSLPGLFICFGFLISTKRISSKTNK